MVRDDGCNGTLSTNNCQVRTYAIFTFSWTSGIATLVLERQNGDGRRFGERKRRGAARFSGPGWPRLPQARDIPACRHGCE